MSGGTNNGLRPARYHYWRVGYGARGFFGLDFWVERAGEFHCKPGYVTGSVDHPEWTQVFFHLSGAATFDAGGHVRPVARGDLLIIPHGHKAIYSSNNGMKYHWFALGQHWPPIFGAAPHVQMLSPGYDAEVEARFTEIREILILRRPGYPLKAVGVIYELMARLEEIKRAPVTADSVYPEAVRNAIIYLRENYTAPYDAAQLAAAVSLSQSYLRALFEKWVGESPRQFHRRCRIDQAKRLLSEQRLPVAEVALLVGFNDGRYFSRVFKQVTGVPPSQYSG